MHPVKYMEWSETAGEVQRELLNLYVSREELFLRKLVNATVIQNRVFEHTSHESEDNRQHAIYARPFREDGVDLYGPAILRHVYDSDDLSVYMEAAFSVWNQGSFEQADKRFGAAGTMEIAQLLLDHYLVENGRTYEVVYTALDHERKKVFFFLREVMEPHDA